jgi:hypothetical protein
MATIREALIAFALFLMVLVGAVAIDGLLHLVGQPGWGRYLGYWGTGLIAVSFLYSARKRKKFNFGRAPFFLRLHEFLASVGAAMILVHAGIHFNGLLPWLTLIAMLINVASGLTGKFLLKRSKNILAERRKSLLNEGQSKADVEDRLYWDSLVVGVMQKWRKIHVPITTIFGLLVALHVTSVIIFWRW